MNHTINQLLHTYTDRDVLRFITCGSVDDGKSTLIGRLLFENNCLYEDQLKALEKISKGRGIKDNLGKEIDYSLLLDGLQAEIEQGITIDVSYRYFSTSKRNYIVADTPGHDQYTRNMATGASTADLAVLLLDASKGILEQTKRHLFITSLMGIKNFIVVINKMDLINYKEETFVQYQNEYLNHIKNIDGYENFIVTFIPVSALKGDNVASHSKKMSWYKGKTLTEALDSSEIEQHHSNNLRFLVKYVNRPNSDFRGYCGLVALGTIKVGDKILILPSKKITTVKSIVLFNKSINEAHEGDSVCLCVKDNIDISRGDLITKVNDSIKLCDQIESDVIWMDENELSQDSEYLIRFNNRTVNGNIKINFKNNIINSTKEKTKTLQINEIGNCDVIFNEQIAVDPFTLCKTMGSFIIIDKVTNKTSGAGVITFLSSKKSEDKTLNTFWFDTKVKRRERTKIKRQNPYVIWLTGLSGAGKSTIANELEYKLLNLDYHTYLLDGDNVRHGLNKDLDFSDKGRSENIRRVAEVSKLMIDAGLIVITAFISPFERDRQIAREIIGKDNFIQVFIDTPLKECIKRDPKKLYKGAISGNIFNFTGVGSRYDVPKNNDLIVKTLRRSPEVCTDQILEYIQERIKG